ncbi:MAG: hypothetical protein ACLR23_23365 [Clostridia bacterium]
MKVAKGDRADATGVALINNIFTGTLSWPLLGSSGLEHHNKENAGPIFAATPLKEIIRWPSRQGWLLALIKD